MIFRDITNNLERSDFDYMNRSQSQAPPCLKKGCRSKCPHPKGRRRCHWTRKGGKWKPKKPYPSEADALRYIADHHLQGYRAYLCPECGSWHIGYSNDGKSEKLAG